MLTYEQWIGAISDEAAQGVFAEFEGAKNRNVCVDMVRWTVATGRAWRTKDGFHLVRGSVKHRPDGLKEDPFLQSIGITAAKIRGFLKQCLKRGIIEILSKPNEPDESGRFWRLNRNGRPRNPPVVYRFTKAFLNILRRGQNAKESGPKVALSPLAETRSFLPEVAPNASQDYQDLEEGSGGYLTSSPSPVAPATGPKLTISQRAMRRFKPPSIPLPAIQQPAPTKPATPAGPLRGTLAASLANLRAAMFGGGKQAVAPTNGLPTRVPPPGLTSAALNASILAKPVPVAGKGYAVPQVVADLLAGDRRFEQDFPTVIVLKRSEWPQVIDPQGKVVKAVYVWLMEHAGIPGRTHGIRSFHEDPLGHHRLGFRDDAAAFEFRMRWGGKAADSA